MLKITVVCLLAFIALVGSRVIIIKSVRHPHTSSSSRVHERLNGGRRFEDAERAAAKKSFHNSGKREYHDITEHHRKTITISKTESSERHEIGGSVEFNNGAASSGAFQKHLTSVKRNEHKTGAHASATASG